MLLNQRSGMRRYAAAVVAAMLAVVLRAELDAALGPTAPFIVAYPAVVLAAWYGGFGPGLVATLLSMGGIASFVELAVAFGPDAASVLRLTLFGLSGTLTSFLCELLHREHRRAETSGEQRSRAEALLRERDLRLQRIMDAVPALISYVDESCRYRHANRTYERWFGHDPQSIKGKHLREVLGEEAFRAIEPYVERALAGEEVSFEQELPYRRTGARWVHVNYTPDRGPDGEVRGFVTLVNDISERQQADAERARLYASEREARARAEASDRAKDQFLAVLSHELRTPLTPVLAAAQLLETTSLSQNPQRVRAHAALIRKNAELEARLIDDLLDLTRVSRGMLTLNFESVDVHAEIGEVLSVCAPDIDAKRLRIELDLGAREHRVNADHARLQQVIWNLVKNAVKFSHEGGRVSIRTRTSEAGELRLEVQDEGVGIDQELLPRLFCAFEQGSREVTRHFGGLGLGLAVSKALVEAQGGTISAASGGKERGATFTITMPVARPSVPAAQRSSEEQPTMTQTHRILLVEDHEDTSEIMAEFLESSGYQVKIADTVESALQIAGAEEFDLVLSDLGLPDGTGYDLMRQLRERHHLRGVALSGYGRDKDVEEAREAGFVEHVTKPPNPQQLLKVISRVLDAQPSR